MTVNLNDIRWRGSYFPVEVLETLTADGDVVINSADQPYDAQSIARNWSTIIVEFFTTTLDVAARSTWVNRKNSDVFWGFALDKLQLARWDFHLLYDNDNAPYIKNVAEVWINDNGWDVQLPNYGTVELGQGGPTDPENNYLPILFGPDKIPGTNLMLDVAGQIAADQTTAITNPTPYHKTLAFASTPLPATLPTALGGP